MSLVDGEDLVPYFRQLPGYRFAKGWHTALCPIHDDKMPTLGLSTGRGVLKCFSGCDFASLMRHFRLMGFDDGTPKPTKPLEWSLVTTYTYVSYDGEIVGTKERWEAWNEAAARKEKRFTWKTDLSMRDMPLYGWQTIKDKQVFWVEGEKAADALHQAGKAAVTTGGGSSVTELSEHVLAPLKGKDVIIWRDNDEPGRKYALGIARVLWPVANSVKIICWTNGGKGADAADYLPLGLPIEALLQTQGVVAESISADHIRVTVETDIGPSTWDFENIHAVKVDDVECELTVSVLNPEYMDAPANCRTNLLSLSARQTFVRELSALYGKAVANGGWTEIASKAYAAMTGIRKDKDRAQPLQASTIAKSLSWVVRDIIPEREDSVIFALEGAGKSLLTTAIAASVALGEPFAGEFETSQGGVLFVDYERDKDNYEERMGRVLAGMGYSPNVMADLPLRYWPGQGVIFADQAFAIAKAAAEIDAKLIIIDSIGFAVAGDMFNPSAPMGFYRRRMPCATLAIGQRSQETDRAYGNKYWEYAIHGRMWAMERKYRDDHLMRTRLECRKISDGTQPKDIDVMFAFRDDRSIGVATDDAIKVNLTGQIARALMDYPDGMYVKDIADAIEQTVQVTERALSSSGEFEAFTDSTSKTRWRIV